MRYNETKNCWSSAGQAHYLFITQFDNTERIDSYVLYGWWGKQFIQPIFKVKCIIHTCLMINYTYLHNLSIKTQIISHFRSMSVLFHDFPTEDIFINKPIPRVRSSSYRGGVILIDLNYSRPDSNCLRTRIPRNISWKPLFGVFGCFRWIFTHFYSSVI